MALIAAFSENMPVDVLNVSECHYLLSMDDKTCHKLELIAKPIEESKKLSLLFHGIILQDAEYKLITTTNPYKQLLDIGHVTSILTFEKIREANGIIDCRQTFKNSGLETNTGYEGVRPMRSIDCDSDRCSIYGVDDVNIPECSISVRTSEQFSLVEIEKIDGSNFLANELNAFRLIFFLSSRITNLPWYESWWNKITNLFSFIVFGHRTHYGIHLFSLPGSIRECCGTWAIDEALIKECRLFLNASIFMEYESLQRKIQQELDEGNISTSDVENAKQQETSDVFIFTDRYSRIDTKDLKGNALPEVERPDYLLFSNKHDRRLNINRYHIKIARDLNIAELQRFIKTKDFRKIELSVDFGFPRIRGLFGKAGTALLSVFAISLAISVNSFSGDDKLSNSIKASLTIVIGITLLYILLKLSIRSYRRKRY